MTTQYAQDKIKAKDQKEAEIWANKLARARKREATQRGKELKATAVEARRSERRRKKALKSVVKMIEEQHT